MRVVVAMAAWLAVSTAVAQQTPPEEQGPKVDWTAGPETVDVGKDNAQLALPEGYLFAGPEDTQAILQRLGNRTDGSELGLVVPADEGQEWFVVFEWQPVGFVKDDEKDEIDADALLKSIREATENGNEWRKERGLPALHVTGWAEPPHYDERTHHLTWAMRARNEAGGESVNYNVRILGRAGYMSATLVDGPDGLAASKPKAEQLLTAFSYKQGSRYAEWVPGDKVAEYGLTALVAAGAGAGAAKLGLFAILGKALAKMGKLLVVFVAAIGAGLVKLWNAARGRASARPEPPARRTDVDPQA